MRTTIVTAGGGGKRMGSEIPKQFLPVNGKPVLIRTLERLADFDPGMRIILALPADQTERWKQLCLEFDFTLAHIVVLGGATRFMSVRNALAHAPHTGFIAVHDGVRPFASEELIARCFAAAETAGAAVPAIAPVDSLRFVTSAGSTPVDRSAYRLVQTPQVFEANLLHAAYGACDEEAEFTDDASVVEHYGHTVTMIDGERENIKITTPFDLAVAEAWISF